MAFDPMSLLILKFRGRSVAVLRAHCSDYDSVVAAAWNNLRSLKHFPNDDLVFLASIPGYPDTSEVELSKGVWPSVSAVVHSVTIALESEMETSATAESARSKVQPVPRVRLPPGNKAPPAVPPVVPPVVPRAVPPTVPPTLPRAVPPVVPSVAESLRFNFDGPFKFPAEPPSFNFNRQTPVAKDGPQTKVNSEEYKQQ